MAQKKKGRTATRVIKLLLEMLTTPTKVLDDGDAEENDAGKINRVLMSVL